MDVLTYSQSPIAALIEASTYTHIPARRVADLYAPPLASSHESREGWRTLP